MTETTLAAQPLAERFAAMRTATNACFFDALAKHYSCLASDSCIEMYFRFAMSANDRGRTVADLLERYANLSDADYLDIGCAYGGFLVAFAERGARVLGVEIAPNWIDLAKENFKDFGRALEVVRKDATQMADMIEYCNRFDIVTCNDVIEHVTNPYALVEIISLVLRHRGIAYLEIPNRNWPRFVLSDGHYGLFGITLLELDDARVYYELCHPDRKYDTIRYLALDQYLAIFDRVGLQATLMDETFADVEREGVLKGIELLRSEQAERLAAVPEGVRERLSTKLAHYLSSISRAASSPKEENSDFLTAYGPSFWRILLRKDPGKMIR